MTNGGMQLSTYLRQTNLSGAAFGKRVGVSRQTISAILNGRIFPRRTLIERIAAETAGQVTANDLLTERSNAA